MYSAFFGFSKEPFNVTPDPEFLYLSPDHREALASLIYAVDQGKGFVVIIGEVGVGKTTVIRTYLDLVDRRVLLPVYLFNSNLSFNYLLKTILRELDCKNISDETNEMVNQLHIRLIQEYSQGRIIVLIIDEAQNMPVETLENIRLLSNLESTKGKLIQIVFSAQPEFETVLERHELRQLRQRIAVKATIRLLSVKESIRYIKHRLSKVMADSSAPFSPHALRLIAREAKGAPRLINIYCDNCLLTSYGLRKKKVTGSVVRDVSANFAGSHQTGKGWWLLLAVMVGVVLCAYGMAFTLDTRGEENLTLWERGWRRIHGVSASVGGANVGSVSVSGQSAALVGK